VSDHAGETEEVDERELVPNDVLASGQLTCAACGKLTEAARAVDEGVLPKLHDRSLCWTCGAVSIYDRTSLGYWHLRAPDDDERVEIDANDSVRRARAELAAAKRQGRGPSSIGHSAGGAPPPPDPLVVLATEPVSWDDAAERHGLTPKTVRQLQAWVREQMGSSAGSVQIPCGACDLPTHVPPQAQGALFSLRAKVLCAVCAVTLQQRLGEQS
jgi:hypothetical protein